MTPTLTLKTEELIQALTVRASMHREKATKHAADEMGAFYAHLAEQCELEARQLEAKQLLETVQSDPFAAAMAQAGATEIRWGREKPAENGRQAAPRCTVRAGWPFREMKAEKASPKRWPF
jgi:hypothetical protein